MNNDISPLAFPFTGNEGNCTHIEDPSLCSPFPDYVMLINVEIPDKKNNNYKMKHTRP